MCVGDGFGIHIPVISNLCTYGQKWLDWGSVKGVMKIERDKEKSYLEKTMPMLTNCTFNCPNLDIIILRTIIQ